MLISELDEDAVREQSVVAGAGELRAEMPDNDAANVMSEAKNSQTADVQIVSNLNEVLSGNSSTSVTAHKKKSTQDRAARRYLVCKPCKKRFSRRRKLDQHNRLVHSADATYSCDDCHKTFSRRDNIARHVKLGKCPAHAQQSATDADLSVITTNESATDADLSIITTNESATDVDLSVITTDDTELPNEISMLICIINFGLYLIAVACFLRLFDHFLFD